MPYSAVKAFFFTNTRDRFIDEETEMHVTYAVKFLKTSTGKYLLIFKR
jgi:hypothetical protein